MKIDMQRLLHDHSIPVGGKLSIPDWLNIRCPFCNDRSNHLGWNISEQYWNCYRCGAHRINETISELLNISETEAWKLCKQYDMRPGAALGKQKPDIIKPTKCIVPGNPIKHSKAVNGHALYLESRGYDAYTLADLWQLHGTGHLATGTNKFRVVCPIYHNGKIVSWQGRDITGKSPLRWKSCPAIFELRAHKHCLGGEQLIPRNSVAIVEGFTDAWRLGPGAVCTFGTDYLLEQCALLRVYKRRFIVLDSENKDPNAATQADKLANILSAFPGETIIIELDNGDPGDLPQAEANYLMEKEWRIR